MIEGYLWLMLVRGFTDRRFHELWLGQYAHSRYKIVSSPEIWEMTIMNEGGVGGCINRPFLR